MNSDGIAATIASRAPGMTHTAGIRVIGSLLCFFLIMGMWCVLPANYTLRAIPLAAGSHHFRLEYRPDGFVVGRWVTVLSLLVYAAVSAGQVWRRGVRSSVRIDPPEPGR